LEPSEGSTIASLVRRLVDSDPCLRECLRRRLLNFSEAARQLKSAIEESTGRSVSIESIKSALIRYSERLRGRAGREPGFVRVLAGSSIELRAPVSVAVFSRRALPSIVESLRGLSGSTRLLLLLQSYTSIVVIADSNTISTLVSSVDKRHLIEVWERQAAIVIVSPREVVEVPGFIAHITGLLASHGINIQQIESVHTDTVIIVSSGDAIRAYQLIMDAVEQAKRALSA